MPNPTSISTRISQAFTGPAWHGAPLAELLADVTCTEAAERPFDDVHTIAELVGHIGAWTDVAEQRLAGEPTVPDEAEVWPDIDTTNEHTWTSAVASCLEAHRSLTRAVEALGDNRLTQTVPGQDYDAATMLRGIVEHDAYHGGQIAMLKKLIRARHARK